MINVVVVDDHPAVRLGLQTALETEPGLAAVGAAASAAELAPLLYSCRPDVVLLDYNLPDADGLTVCRDVKATATAPAVILYSAFADGSMTVPAIVAGADAILNKGVRANDLFTTIQQVTTGRDALPTVTPDQLHAAGAALEEVDLPILSMLVERMSARDVAEALRVDVAEIHRRIGGMLARLTGSVGLAPPRAAS